VHPTVFADVDNKMCIAQEEIFGPVLVIILFGDDDDDAVRIANDSPYGLSGGVWSADRERALNVARRIRTGTFTVNGAQMGYEAQFGDYQVGLWCTGLGAGGGRGRTSAVVKRAGSAARCAGAARSGVARRLAWRSRTRTAAG
jgi:acyl-CoA reductase-like NAD-dependent aldehyde dehydrogenase